MKRILTLTVMMACLAVASLAHAPKATSQLSLIVARVVDGDTLVVRSGKLDTTIRLIGVDTPETVHPMKPVEAFGKEASDFTRRLTEGKQCRLEYDWQRKDKYARTLAYVYLVDDTFVNAEIVKQGYGLAYTKYPFKFLDQFREYERAAREKGLGLWATREVASEPGQQRASTVAVDPREDIVYITRTGAKFHSGDCRHLAKSKIAIKRKDAIARGYDACKVCRP